MMLQKKGLPIAKVTGDDDHTGINRVHQWGNTEIEKESDKNHVQKKCFQETVQSTKVSQESYTKSYPCCYKKTLITCCSRIVGKPEKYHKWLKGSSWTHVWQSYLLSRMV